MFGNSSSETDKIVATVRESLEIAGFPIALEFWNNVLSAIVILIICVVVWSINCLPGVKKPIPIPKSKTKARTD